MRNRIALLIVPALLAVPVACSTPGTTSSGTHLEYNSLSGNLTATFDAPLDRAFAASIGAINDLQFTISENKKDAMEGLLAARTAGGSTVRVTAIRKGDNVTEVTVGVGTFGKEATAHAVMDKISSRLK
jgi:hypothetical protein